MDTTPTDYSDQPKSTKKTKLPLIILAVLLIVALPVGIFMVRNNSLSAPAEPTPTPTEMSTPSPEPTPTVAKDSVKIRVLNGTGTPGQAGKVVTALKNAGYSADNIKTGNSTETRSVASVELKTGFENAAEDIKSVLSSDFPEIEISTTTLESDNEFDIIVTTGGEKFIAPTKPPAPTGKSFTPTPTTSSSTTGTPTPTSTTGTPTPTRTPTPTPSRTPTPTP